MRTSYRGNDVTSALRSFLAASALMPSDLAVLEVLWHSSLSPAKLISAATRGSKGCGAACQSKGRIDELRITRAQAETAVVGLVDWRLLRLIDSARRSHIAMKLASDSKVFFTPDQIPNVGDVDLTSAGVRLIMRLYRTVFEWTETVDCMILMYTDEQTARVCATSEAYLRRGLLDLSDEHSGQLPSVKTIAQVKGWRDRWWRKRHRGVMAELLWTTGGEEETVSNSNS